MSGIEEKIVFAISPDGQGDGVPVILMGIPAGAWEYMRNGKTHTFDLTKAGLPVKFVLYGAADHAEAMKVMEATMAASGTVIDDRRRDDFSIKPKDRK